MAVCFILIEEETGVRPPHGFIVTGDGQRHRINNTPELRAWVLDVADQIRAARRQMAEII
jgi:CRISPR-associated exonuclease Cas4